jgi:hypothetical protein
MLLCHGEIIQIDGVLRKDVTPDVAIAQMDTRPLLDTLLI